MHNSRVLLGLFAVILSVLSCGFLRASDDMNVLSDEINPTIRVVFFAKSEAVISSQIEGVVTAIDKVFGASFSEGETLIKIDDILYTAILKRSQAAKSAAEVNLLSVQNLSDRNDATNVELENAKRDLIFAEAELEIAQRNFDSCIIKAPFPGRVERVFINEHELVEEKRPLIKIFDDSVLLGHFLLPEGYFSALKVGEEVPISLPGVSTKIPAKIARKGAAIDPASKTFEVFVELANPEGKIGVGTSGILEIADLNALPSINK